MSDWMKFYPSAIVNRETDGDREYAKTFKGEADKLLYQLKNLMKFRNLGQLKMTRVFTDGTVITARSVFGRDSIIIDTSRSTEVEAAERSVCTITFIDFPDAVQPMRYPGEIHDGEVQGTDYIKTYYITDVVGCPNCQDIAWEFILTYSIPPESRHYEDEPDNHTVYSLEPPACGEIIEQGSDDDGTYIIWKAYTESGEGVTYSRSGLAIPLLRATINDENGEETCDQEHKFDVDCCQKTPDLRDVEIWWEGVGECTPFIIYGDLHLCKTPTSFPMTELVQYACTYPYQPFYAIQEIKGSCLPVEWTLSGPIEFLNSDKNDNLIYIKCVNIGCNDSAIIALMDRCGTFYTVTGRPCCVDADELTINYTSLLMACNAEQNLTALGGCAPYLWSISGGGGTLSSETGVTVTYTAPAENPNCGSNPTIQVSDCCGNMAEIKLAVNCYTGEEPAVGYAEITYCTDRDAPGPMCWYRRSVLIERWRCDGTLLYSCETNPEHDETFCNETCANCGCVAYEDYCWTGQCGAACGGISGTCGFSDCRTQDMKDDGCCPINPITGLPY